ncbi:MAG: PD40 domain-containing protein [Sphingomonadales bacterium]|nr:PD40 domain-containing protein [Sphingomonadales bacterium]MDE2168424.1 PD40 domain-containing protein [Sphingomonadales bacterium]
MKAGMSCVARAISMLALALSSVAAHAAPANPPPPGAGRTVAFDVHAGTSYSVSVSPDGQWLAFDLQGSLWVVSSKGGAARRITDYFNDAHLPVWSPDGRHLAYYAYRDGDYDLWMARPDGSDAHRLTHSEDDDRDPAWSPDGKTIAFASDRAGSYDIWALDIADGALRQITKGPREDRAPAWSTDGKTIAFSSTQGGQNGIYSVPSAGGEVTPLAIAPAGARYDAPSLGAGKLAYVVLDRAGSHLDIDGKLVSGGENVFPFPLRWQGEDAYYISDGLIRHRKGSSVTTVPFTARLEATKSEYTRARRDFTSTQPRRVLGIGHPTLSPDGQRIAFTALGDLWVVSSQGGKPEQLTHDAALEADAAWSPDGKFLAYSSDKGGGLLQLWVRDMATGKDRQITNIDTQPLGAAWSPDGTRIAFLDVDGRWGVAGLETVDVASGVVTRLQPSLAQPGKPTWSPDGRYVAVALSKAFSASFREGRNQIWVVPSDGKGAPFWRDADPVTSLDTRGGGGPVWSPDGQKMAAIQDGLLKVWPVGKDASRMGPERSYSSEISYYPTWSGDSRRVLYQAADKLKIVDVESGETRDVPLDFTYRLDIPKTRIVIHAGHLVDAVHDATQLNKDIVIEGNRIVAVQDHDPRLHAGADKVIDGSGLTAIPGLIEHHAHVQKDFGANLHLAWLSYGITTVRDPGNQPYDGVEDREASEAGVRIGPRIYTTGPLLEWRRVFYRMGVAVNGPAHLERELDRARALHYDLVKSYVRMPDLQQRRIVEVAHQMGVPVATHEIFPAAYTGVDNTEHLGATSRRGFSPKQGPQGRVYEDVIQLFGRSGRTLTPTNFGALDILLDQHPELRKDPRLAFYPQWAQKTVTEGENLPPVLMGMQAGQLAGLKALRDAGTLVVAGTDTMIAPNLDGEIASYVRAGFTPFEALQTATVNAAKALNLDAGTLEPGKLADIALIDGDPRKDITAIFKVRDVVANGRPYTVADLLAKAHK